MGDELRGEGAHQGKAGRRKQSKEVVEIAKRPEQRYFKI